MTCGRTDLEGAGLMIASAHSGSGKTLVTLGALRAARDRGLAAVGAKSGPDYIDPMFHQAACGTASATLDAWAMSADALRALAAGQIGGPLIVEAAMGLLDGAARAGDAPGASLAGAGAASELAAALGAPVALVIDAAKSAQSAAIIAAGARALAPELEIAGVVLNRVGSDRHAALASGALEAAGFTVFGAIPRSSALQTPSRHLGLTPAAERADLEAFIAGAARVIDASLDLDALFGAARPLIAPTAQSPMVAPPPPGRRIALAQDLAFCFVYPHHLAAWRASGAEIAPFSPLADQAPDPDADAVVLPGGYPELHAGRLASAGRFRAGVRAAAGRGAAVYGECGGYMALGAGVVDAEGRRHEMLGLLPVETSFAERRLHLGYRRLSPTPGGPFQGPLAAHEFHYATVLREGPGDPLFEAWDAAGAPLGPMGRRVGRVSGSFAHVIAPGPAGAATGRAAAAE